MKQLCLFSTERGRSWESGARWIINHTLTCFQMNATFAFCQFKKNFGKNWTNPRERGWQIQPQSPSFQFIKLEPCASPPYIFVSSILSLHLEPLNEWDIISVLKLLARGLCGLSWLIPLLFWAPCDPRWNKKIKKYWSNIIRNTVRSYGEIKLTMLEKYSQLNSDPDTT